MEGMENIETIKILSTVEQVIKIDWQNREVSVESNKIVNSKIVDEKNIAIHSIRYQFTITEVDYGIISLGKKHPLSYIYEAGKTIKVIINGIDIEGKFHSSQVRIDGLRRLFKQFKDLEARVFNLEYDAKENSLKFSEI